MSEWNAGNLSVYDPAASSWEVYKLPGEAPHAYAVYVDGKDKVYAAAEPHGNPQGADGLAVIPEGQLEAVIESAEECPGECIFIEVE